MKVRGSAPGHGGENMTRDILSALAYAPPTGGRLKAALPAFFYVATASRSG